MVDGEETLTADEQSAIVAQPGEAALERTVAVYTDSIERVPVIAGGRLQIADAGILKTWFA